MDDQETAKQFKDYMEKYLGLYEYVANKIKEKLSNISKPVILDVGMGPGLLCLEIHKVLPNAKIFGLDSSIEMINLAKDHALNNDFKSLKTLHSSAEIIPLEKSSVDCVVSRFSLPYWDDPKKVFFEINRVLKSNGFFFLEALNKDFPSWKLKLVKFHMILNKASRNVVKYHIDAYKICNNFEEVQSFLNKSGFDVIDFEGNSRDWKFFISAKKTN